MKSIYLDHAASTPVHPEVAKVMYHILTEEYGNASSVHHSGRSAKRIVNGARDTIAGFLGCAPDEWVFTSGGTESDNLALLGAAAATAHKGKHIITTAIEHHAVLHTCEQLERQGYSITYLPADSTGRVSASDVEAALREDTVLISVMFANNEVGTVQPIEEIGRLAAERGALFHVDAVQALGMVPFNLRELPVDYMSFTAHKINGPQGIGGLYVRRGAPLHQGSTGACKSAAGGPVPKAWPVRPALPRRLSWRCRGLRSAGGRRCSCAAHCSVSWTSGLDKTAIRSTAIRSIFCRAY